MSNTRNLYDPETYYNLVQQSMKPGLYMTNEPYISCKPCYPKSPQIRLQSQGASINKNTLLVDIDSELMNLNRKLAKNPCNHYIPSCPGYQCSGTGMPCGQGVTGQCTGLKPGQRPGDENLIHFQDCDLNTMVYTRLNNPPCNLRATGINRWEWLCKDPQKLPLGLLLPFDWNIPSKQLSKDTHRPCIPTPMTSQLLMPTGGELPQGLPTKFNPNIKAPPIDPISVGWQSSQIIRNY
jgi:hypothetical protein